MDKQIVILCAASVVLLTGGCGSPAGNSAAGNAVNAGAPVVNVNNSPANQVTTTNARTIETAEPDKYSATLQLKAETVGGEQVATPTLTADVARDGEKRRVEFLLPSNERLIYMNLGGSRYLVIPSRRQYVEIDPNSAGFELPRLMMPDQIVEYLKGRNDYQRIGEESFRGRTVVKYRTAGSTDTGTDAGRIRSESFTYVDKDTGLPLRAELQSQSSGKVGGVEGVNAVVEMHNVNTNPNAELFELPNDYAKVTAEQVRNQISIIGRAALAIAGTLMAEVSQPTGGTTPPANAAAPSNR